MNVIESKGRKFAVLEEREDVDEFEDQRRKRFIVI
jgi:hypothetical protein